MFCVFIKELKQFRHCQIAVLMLLLVFLLSAGAVAAFYKDSSTALVSVLLGSAYLFAGIEQLCIIVTAASRWKNENGNGSIDIICTTPISPLAVACAKTAAATLCAFTGMVLPVAASGLTNQDISFITCITFVFLQVAALCSVSLGAASFQHRKNNSFDWTIVLTILALLPLISLISGGRYDKMLDTTKFFASSAGFISATAFGIALAVCGASPKNSDRAMPLKTTAAAVAALLPIVYKFTITKDVPLDILLGKSFFIASLGIMFSAMFERKKQSRRVLANTSSKLLFPFSTGVANSFVLMLIFGTLALAIPRSFEHASVLAKIFLLTGICQLTRDSSGSRFPTITAITIGFLTLIISVTLPFVPQETAAHLRPVLLYTDSPGIANLICLLLGTAIYIAVCSAQFKQYLHLGTEKNG